MKHINTGAGRSHAILHVHNVARKYMHFKHIVEELAKSYIKFIRLHIRRIIIKHITHTLLTYYERSFKAK